MPFAQHKTVADEEFGTEYEKQDDALQNIGGILRKLIGRFHDRAALFQNTEEGGDQQNAKGIQLAQPRDDDSGEAAPAPDVPERPAMIVSGLRHDNGDLGQFVDEVRRGGAVIPLRAMVTPTSRSWTLAALLAELNREHEHVGGQA